ncbi:MAG: hypothetical protein GY707_08825, partial [Desulfobacteraceae bacterium]|nr:hypothetical protein [Desulfobacteraceae bacterium]
MTHYRRESYKMANKTKVQKAKSVREICQNQPKSQSDGIVECKQQGCISEAGSWSFSNNSNSKLSCNDDCKPVKKNCELTEKQRKKFATDEQKQREKLEKRNKAFSRRKSKNISIPKNKDDKEQPKKVFHKKNYNWKHQHCQDIMIMPTASGIKNQYNQLRENIIDDMLVLEEKLEDIVLDTTVELGGKSVAKFGARSGAKMTAGAAGFFGGPTGLLTEGLAVLSTIVDGVNTIIETKSSIVQEVEKFTKVYNEKQAKIQQLSKDVKRTQKYIDLNSRNNPKNLGKELNSKEKETLKDLNKEIQEKTESIRQKAIESAKKNPCLRAKKCQLVTFQESDEKSKQMNSPNGCCPGQTGHHLLPKSYFNKNCPEYNEKHAPCVCVEGSNQYLGTHGNMHTFQDKHAEDEIENGQLSYLSAKKAAIQSLKDTYTTTKCDSACIEQQLDEYHTNICGKEPIINPV